MKALISLPERYIKLEDVRHNEDDFGSHILVDLSDGSRDKVPIVEIRGDTLAELADNIMGAHSKFMRDCLADHEVWQLANIRVYVVVNPDMVPAIMIDPNTLENCVLMGAFCPSDGVKVVGEYA